MNQNRKINGTTTPAGRPPVSGYRNSSPKKRRVSPEGGKKPPSGSSGRAGGKPVPPDSGRRARPKEYNNDYYVNDYGQIKKNNPKNPKIKPPKVRSPRARKAVRIVTYSSIFLAFFAVGVVLSLTVFFKTQYINVNGKTRYDVNDVIAAAGIQKEDNIFLADKEQAAANIIEKYPYIEEAAVTFRIPDSINIELKEAQPSYAIKLSGNYLLISNKGRILENTGKISDTIPLLVGPSLETTEEGAYVAFENENVVTILSDIISSVETNEFADIKSIDISNLAKIKLLYDDRIEINLGMPEDIDYKIRTAIKIIFEKLDPDNTRVIKGELDVSSCNVNLRQSTFTEKTLDVTIPPESTGPGEGPSGEGTSFPPESSSETASGVEDTTAGTRPNMFNYYDPDEDTYGNNSE